MCWWNTCNLLRHSNLCSKETEVVFNYFWTLDIFNIMSGPKLNYNKSSINTWSPKEDYAKNIATTSGCLKMKFPVKYLGSPIGGSMKRAKA